MHGLPTGHTSFSPPRIHSSQIPKKQVTLAHIQGPTSAALAPYSSSLFCIARQFQNSLLRRKIGNLDHHHSSQIPTSPSTPGKQRLLLAVKCFQGNGFWAGLLLHKRCSYLKNRVTYTRTLWTLKFLPLQLWQDFHGITPACTICWSLAGERKSMHLEAPLVSTQPAWDGEGSALYSCLLIVTGVSSAISTFKQEAEEMHYPLQKGFSSKLLLFWMAQTSVGFWESAFYTLLAQPVQLSKSRNKPSSPDNLFSQTFSHPEALLGSLQMFMTLLCHCSVMLPKCLPNVWLLKKHGCL